METTTGGELCGVGPSARQHPAVCHARPMPPKAAPKADAPKVSYIDLVKEAILGLADKVRLPCWGRGSLSFVRQRSHGDFEL
jgi:hypothetical protein